MQHIIRDSILWYFWHQKSVEFDVFMDNKGALAHQDVATKAVPVELFIVGICPLLTKLNIE